MRSGWLVGTWTRRGWMWPALLCALATQPACSKINDDLLKPPDVGSGAMRGGDGDMTGDGDMAGDGDVVGDGDGPGDGDGSDSDAGMLDQCTVEPDSTDDPTCTRDNATTACYEGDCYLVDCRDGFRDCNLDPDDGCEVPYDSVEHCGACNQPCQRLGSVFECVGGACVYQGCAEGFADCDEDPENGCEVDITTTRNCGQCDNACDEPTMATPACIEGQCGVGECQPGFGDCDGDATFGCEQPLNTIDNCGACGEACDLPGATATVCEQGQCRVSTCEPDLYDCNGLGDDGCETTLEVPEHCGACGEQCDLPNTAAYVCNAGTCAVDHSCDASNDPDCVEDDPQTGCKEGFADCNGNSEDGCEADLTDLATCGGCGGASDCRVDNTLTECSEGACVTTGCKDGYADCNGDGQCTSLAMDDANCGMCENACDTGATTPEFCAGGACTTVSCPADRADCNNTPLDGPSNDGCEVSLTSVNNCGACGVPCGPFENASGSCGTGSCTFTCVDPYEDCDQSSANGCEANLTSSTRHCGACGNDCSKKAGVSGASCTDSACVLTGCNPGREDCDGNADNGCEVNLGQPRSCGACNNDCTALPHTENHGCNMGSCTFTCAAGWADCNKDPTDGCEADLGAVDTCGSCANDCTALSNVTGASCNGGSCGSLVCAMGYDDCDGSVVNGCEESVQDVQSCGACDVACAPTGAAETSCPGGSCTVDSCEPGRGNCDGIDSNGCEVNTQSNPSHCGGCGIDCNGGPCNSGVCGCGSDSDCGSGESCCDGECLYTKAVCEWYPCGVSADRQNCGGCGVVCNKLQCCIR